MLSPIFGYQTAVEVARKASSQGTTIGQAAIEMGLLSPEEADELLNPKNLIDLETSSQLIERYKTRKNPFPKQQPND